MSNILARLNGIALAVALGGTAVSASAEIIYDNTTVPYLIGTNVATFSPTIVSGTTLEVGDQINLAGTARILTDFSFEYFGTFSSGVEACIRFYFNDGAPGPYVPSPSTKFWDSGWYGIPSAPLGGNVYYSAAGSDWALGSLIAPMTNFTWTAQFRNLSGGDTIGLVLANPTDGSSYDDYWTDTTGSGGWLLQTNSLAPMNFVAKLEAVPEPGTATILLASALGTLALVARRRKG